MAVTPLFATSLSDIQESLRFSGLATSKDAYQQFLDGVTSGKLFFYRQLGDQRVTEILAITLVENPSTEAERLRSLAMLVEIKAVKLHLLKHMPTQFIDGGGEGRFGETPWKDSNSFVLAEQRRMLEDEINQDMDILAGSESEGNETSIRVMSLDPIEEPPLPGDSVGIIL